MAMKDAEIIIIKAFLFALSQQQNSLDEDIVLELQAVASSLENRVMDLHTLALNNQNLRSPYENARLCLISTAAERGIGIDVLPAEDNGEEKSREIENISRDTQKDTAKMEKVLAAIDSQYHQVEASQVFAATNPIQAIRNRLNRLFP